MDREKFKQIAQQKIEKFSDEINKLEKKKDKVSSDMRQEFEQQLAKLKKKKSELEKSYKEVKQSSDLNWDIIHETFEDTAESIKKGVNDLTEAVS